MFSKAAMRSSIWIGLGLLAFAIATQTSVDIQP